MPPSDKNFDRQETATFNIIKLEILHIHFMPSIVLVTANYDIGKGWNTFISFMIKIHIFKYMQTYNPYILPI